MADLLKLHVGCGKRFIPGFIHIDQVDLPHIDLKQDIRRLANLADGCASLIYACQCITYFDRDEILDVLSDWRRVLTPGGIIRLSVPNFEVIARLYTAGLKLGWFLGTLYGRWPDGKGGYIYERTTYDEESMRELLQTLGFQDIRLWDWRKTEHALVDDFSQAYFPHMEKERGILFNLNIEAQK